MTVVVVPLADWHARMKAQGVGAIEHIAFKCVMCGTVQSIASLVAAGVPKPEAEKCIGFSCEGRWTNAGPPPRHPGADKNRGRGCNWTLGGLFQLHQIEVEMEDGKRAPAFDLATPDEAQALAALHALLGEPAQ